MEIRVEHLTRVEGHGNILATVQDGRVEQAVFEIVEAARFFEGFVRGRAYDEVCHIASRICGICALSHNSAAIQATEKALGIQPSEQTLLLRRIIMNAETVSSHALHVYFLAAPDFLGVPSVVPLIEQDPETVQRAFRLKKTGYELGEVFVGRHTHPVAVIPGGFTSLPRREAIAAIRDRVIELRGDVAALVELYRGLDIPDFSRETEFVSISRPDHYPFYAGDIISSDGERVAAEDYREALQEYVVDHSTAKHVRWNRESYMVGALARVNNNWRQLHPEAQQAMKALGLKPVCHNPFMNTAAQVVEIVHCVEDSIELLGRVLDTGLEEEEPEVTPRAGRGIGVVEAPRGLLVHEYSYDEDGKCTGANCVIPTNQNLANLDRDMQALVPQLADQSQKGMQRHLEMLVRAYDPCISCSVH